MSDGDRTDTRVVIAGRALLARLRRLATRRNALRALVGGLVAAIGAAAALLTLSLAPPTRGDVGPGTVEVRVAWRLGGETEIQVPPLGSLSAHTHSAPIGLHGRVDSIDLNQLERLAAEDRPTSTLYAQAESDLQSLARKLAVRVLIGAAVVGAVAGALVSRVRPLLVVAGAAGGVLGVGILLAMTWRGFDPDAFAEPVYEGALERAPEVVETARRHADDYGLIRERVGVLAAQISDLYAVAAADSGVTGRPDDVRILHVSDLHSNPLGVEVIQELAEQFDVDAVLDTGDLTSFGLPVEAEIGRAVEDVPARYLFVPGNHDSAANRAALAEFENVEVVDGVVDVGGVRILGVPDPTFTADNRTSSEQARSVKEDAAPGVAQAARTAGVHVLAVHDPVLARDATGSAPLVVSGHRHARSGSVDGNTIKLGVGSIGATGVGAFAGGDLAIEAQVLHLGRDGCLRALDYVLLDGIDGSFELERRTFELEAEHVRIASHRLPTCVAPQTDSSASPASDPSAPSDEDSPASPSKSSAAELMQ